MKTYKSLTKAVLASLALTFGASSATAQTAMIGVLGLYEGGPISLDTTQISDLGCTIHRHGMIGGAQGDIDLEQPNQFLLLACDASVLEDTARRADFAAVTLPGNTLAVLEGDLVNFEVPETASDVSERQYILKISTYNNVDVDARESELAKLDAVAVQLTDTYATESFVAVNHATGIPTPDEVVVLYYDSPAAGDRFRDQNGDVLNLVGAFNKAHLVNSIYYVGRALQ